MPSASELIKMANAIKNLERIWKMVPEVIENFTERPQQVLLSKEIVKSIETNTWLLAEGPCGVGKSLAYLLGFIASSGKRAVICTANNSLLSQLQGKDMPLVEDISIECGIDMDWIMLQGKGNYMCPSRWARVRQKLDLINQPEMRDLARYIDKLDSNRMHWLGHIDEVSHYEWIRNQLTIPPKRCKMSKCMYCDSCEMYTSRQVSKMASVVVTNYHLWILDTIQREVMAGEENFQPTLGEYDVLIFDEAHELPDIAREFFKLEVSDDLVQSLSKHCTEITKKELGISWTLYKESFKDRKDGYQKSFPVERDVATSFLNALSSVHDDIMNIDPSRRKDADYKAMERIAKIVTMCGDALIGNVSLNTHAYGLYRENKEGFTKTKIECVEISAGDLLRRLYPRDKPIIATSATICTSPGNFKFTKNQLGFDADYLKVKEVQVDSPFDFKRSMIITMSDSPDPNADKDKWIQHCYVTLKSMICSLHGRTLALFTSTTRMRQVAQLLQSDEDIEYPVIAQGDMANGALISAFRDNENVSLLGVASFWTGIDVSGNSLSALFIERVPFEPPTDLVQSAMNEKLDSGKAFSAYTVPKAVVRLKQGVGRLIRSVDDRGLVVFADSRINKARYRKRILNSILSGTEDNAATQKICNLLELIKYCIALRKVIDKKKA